MSSELLTAKTGFGRVVERIGRRLKWFDSPTMEQIEKDETFIPIARAWNNSKAYDPLIGSDAYVKSGLQMSPKTFQTFADSYTGWAFTAINKKAQTIAMLPLKLYAYKKQSGKYLDQHETRAIKKQLREMKSNGQRRAQLKAMQVEKVEITEHPLIDIMRKPNLVQPRFSFWMDLVMKLELTGQAPVYMTLTGARQPIQFYVLPLKSGADVKVIPDPKLIIAGYKYTDGNLTLNLDPDEVMYIHYPSPNSIYEGYSPLLSQTYPFDIDTYLAQYQYAMFKNKTNYGNAFSTDLALTQGQVTALKANIEEQKGALNSGKPVFFHSGLKPTEGTTSTVQESMVDVVADYARTKILSAYQTPEGKIGIVKDVNRANGEALDHLYYTETIQPTTMMIEEYFETDVLPRFDDRLTYDFELPDTRDMGQAAVIRTQNLGTGYSVINEERLKEGLDPVAWGDLPWLPFGLQQWSEEKAELDLMRTQATIDNDGIDPQQQAREEVAATARQGNKPGSEKEPTAKTKTLERDQYLWKDFVHRHEQYEGILFDIARKHLRRNKDDALAWLNTQGNRIAGNINGWSRKKIEQWIKAGDRFDDVLDEAEDMQKWEREFKRPMTAIMVQTGNYRQDQLVKQGLNDIIVGFNINDPSVQKWLGDRMEAFSKEVTGTTLGDIRSVLREGFAEGQSVTQIAETLRGKFDAKEQYRALAIARTETTASMNFSDLEAVKQEDLEDDLEKTWLIADDEARDTHKQAYADYQEGATPGPIALSDYFHVGTDQMQAPGCGAEAKEVINCRCSIGYVAKQAKK